MPELDAKLLVFYWKWPDSYVARGAALDRNVQNGGERCICAVKESANPVHNLH